eukprot:scaffold69543_cov65-Phaeocystis_antarctica.AAC.3
MDIPQAPGHSFALVFPRYPSGDLETSGFAVSPDISRSGRKYPLIRSLHFDGYPPSREGKTLRWWSAGLAALGSCSVSGSRGWFGMW